jgi:hypothetical protein
MNYPLEGMRKSYFARKNSTANFDDNDLEELGYTPEEIAAIKGER